jgi:hypothetical protein
MSADWDDLSEVEKAAYHFASAAVMRRERDKSPATSFTAVDLFAMAKAGYIAGAASVERRVA